MRLKDLIVRLRIEEDNRASERRQTRPSWNPRPMLWNKGRPPTITRRGSSMAMVLSKVL